MSSVRKHFPAMDAKMGKNLHAMDSKERAAYIMEVKAILEEYVKWASALGKYSYTRFIESGHTEKNDPRGWAYLKPIRDKFFKIFDQKKPEMEKVADLIASKLHYADCGDLNKLFLFACLNTGFPFPFALINANAETASAPADMYNHCFLVISLYQFASEKEWLEFFACPDYWPGRAIVVDCYNGKVSILESQMRKDITIFGRGSGGLPRHDMSLGSFFVKTGVGSEFVSGSFLDLANHKFQFGPYAIYDPNTRTAHDVGTGYTFDDRIKLMKAGGFRRLHSAPCKVSFQQLQAFRRSQKPALYELLRNPRHSMIIPLRRRL